MGERMLQEKMEKYRINYLKKRYLANEKWSGVNYTT